MLNKESKQDTRTFTKMSDKDTLIRETLLTVYEALAEKGYEPTSQLVGYILSDDPAYITNHKNARNLVVNRFDRDELLEAIIKYYFIK